MASHQRLALPTIASKEELHTANSLTQTTQWSTLTIGAFLGGVSVKLGYEWAFFFNALSFVFSALCISRLRAPGRGFRAKDELTEARVVKPESGICGLGRFGVIGWGRGRALVA